MNNTLFEKAEFLQYLFDIVPSVMYVVDRDMRIFHSNAAAMHLLNAENEALLLKRGGDVMKCIHSTETQEGCGRSAHCGECVIRNSMNKAFQGERVLRETVKTNFLENGGNREAYYLVTASPFRYDEQDYVLLIMEDVTALKKTEEELQRQAVRLEDANRELDSFSYSVSHDLKSPIQSICGYSELMMEKYSSVLDETGRQYLERITAGGLRMAQLVDDMLALSRVTKGAIRREEVDLSALARAIADDIMRTRTGPPIEFIIAPVPRVSGDGRLLRIVLENLMTNAVKFTAAHPRARIEFGFLKRGDKPVYYVRDDGAGFDMTHADKLFSPFKRLHNASEFPGTGIGLATVQRIIHRHGGSVWAESAVEQGATFYFTL